MASKNFSGVLRDPLGTLANNDKYRFTHVSTTGEVIRGSTSYLTIGDDGVYNIDIEYGNVSIESYSELGKRWIAQGTTTINADTTVTTLPALLNALVPASDALILQLEALLSDAESAADRAESVVAGLGTAANRDVATTAEAIAGTSNKLPDTVGVKAAINATGIGSSSAKGTTDWNTAITNGPFKSELSVGQTNSPDDSRAGWQGYVTALNASNVKQLVWLSGSNNLEIYTRSILGTVRSDWQKIYHTGNLIHAQNNSGATIVSNATIAGSNLSPAKSGAWRNVSGGDIISGAYGLWERV